MDARVRLTLSASGLLAVFLLTASPVPGRALEAVAAPDNETKTADQIVPGKVKITPHRAIYDMSLGAVKNGSNITDVSGRMLFEWADVCDGWAVQQHLQLHFSYAEGDDSNVTSTVVSWESKDGKRYNFNVRRVTDGKETEVYRGKAVINADGSGTVTYSEPKVKEVKLTPGTIFPSAHTEIIIQKALAGEKLFTRRVFDGSDEEGVNDISAFIGPEENHLETTEMNPKLKGKTILDVPGWPVRLAFFKIDTETGEPDYEMDLNLLANGIARRMDIDYGDFSVTGRLSDIEPLPAPGC